MRHFTIDLPENKKADVKCLSIKKIQFSQSFVVGSESPTSESKPIISLEWFKYIVTVSDNKSKMECCLFKSQNGDWSVDREGQIQMDDKTLIFIKNGIITKENELNIQ
jgi:hypothetical protein